MVNIRLLPKDDGMNGWGHLLPARQPRPELVGPQHADWVVVGAGFAGLAAARRLAENQPSARIALLEAQTVGNGTSGRNSGFAIDLPIGFGLSAEGLEKSRRRIRLARAAVEYLQTCIDRGKIECQWRRGGRYHAAATLRGKQNTLDPHARELDALGEPYEWLDRDQMLRATGSAYYHSAIHTAGGALMNPEALTRGLADTLPPNVTLYESTPVVEADFDPKVRLTTPRGTMSAGKMILATNGFAPEFGFFRGRLIIVALYASLTRPLTDAEHDALGRIDDWGLTTKGSAGGVTARYTQDRRILIRKKFEYRPSFRISDAERMAVRREHQRLFEARFPTLPEVDIRHTWAGFVCVAQNQAPGFGRVAPNVYAAVCQNSLGVTMGTIAGVNAADLALGMDSPLLADMHALGQPNRLPPRPFLDIGVRARFAWDAWTTGSDT